MPFVDDPGRVYTDPYAWHSDLVYRVHGPSTGTYNHDLDFRIGPVDFHGSHDANGGFRESFGGPHPGSGASACAWGKVVRGRSLDVLTRFWDGTCPEDDDGPSTDESEQQGSSFDVNTPAEAPLLQNATASVTIGGYLLRPWSLNTFDNPYMDDDALEDEYNAAISATSPGFPWNLEVETLYPVLETFEVAPDETTTGGLRTEGITWLYDPPGGRFAFYGLDESFNGIWGNGAPPEGEELVRYEGGLADWLSIPSEWMPEQDLSSAFFTEMIVPDDPDAATIPLTTVCDTVLTAAYPGDNASGGRTGQTLLVRIGWRPPRFRWYKERTVTPPRRIYGRPGDVAQGAARLYGGGATVQQGRIYGGIL